MMKILKVKKFESKNHSNDGIATVELTYREVSHIRDLCRNEAKKIGKDEGNFLSIKEAVDIASLWDNLYNEFYKEFGKTK